MTAPTISNPHKDAFDPASYVKITRDQAIDAFDKLPESKQLKEMDKYNYGDMNPYHEAITSLQSRMQVEAEEKFEESINLNNKV